MSYSVNPSAFKSIFAVPAEIVDKHIRLANEHQLKVLLWILRYSPDNPDINKLCTDLKINQNDVYDYLQYWVLTGVLKSDDETQNPFPTTSGAQQTTVNTKADIGTKKQDAPPPPSKPSSAEIATRLSESPEIGHLFNEAQIKLGRTIGYDGQCTLLLIHDHYGLPTEVIFMMLDYCVSIGKTNYGYIEAIGKDWGTREIDTLDKAAEQISALRNTNSIWKSFASYAGITNPRPTIKQTEYLRKWSSELKFSIEMIILAYEEAANHTTKLSYSYMDKVLTSWHTKGYKNPADVEKGKEEANSTSQKQTAPKATKTNTASYDLNKFEERSLHRELKYERKKKG
ncbi:MAG: DnaD domain protein [Clostridia bacterium]|nr:DnaD domain protein [Clostridia bacterium]